jgi:D-beta-D-heptose 7-phosphate kinase/D-beta-D-heptose 1-phosphate adenosyltransferase
MPNRIDGGELEALLGNFASKRILVVGDLMLDEFIWGKVSRISPEAPVPVVRVVGESYYPGGAANVARNVREFTPEIEVMGLAGCDSYGQRLLALLRDSGIRTAGVQQHAATPTTVKTRIIARNQQVVRVDREQMASLSGEQMAEALRYLAAAVPAIDGIVVADYGKGFISQEVADAICGIAREHGKTVAVDPHPHTSIRWKGATIIKPNRAEAFLAAGVPPSDPAGRVLEDPALLEAGRRLMGLWSSDNLLITLGEDGMLLLRRDLPPYHIPTRAKEVFDVSGAGDTAIAVLTLALTAGGSPVQAAQLANYASGIAVGKLGTATVTSAELQSVLR